MTFHFISNIFFFGFVTFIFVANGRLRNAVFFLLISNQKMIFQNIIIDFFFIVAHVKRASNETNALP